MGSDWDDDDSDDFFSEEDDDLITQYAEKPPRDTQAPYSQAAATVPSTSVTQVPSTQANTSVAHMIHGSRDLDSRLAELEDRLLKAQGEAGMLRDKLNMAHLERENERRLQLQRQSEAAQAHQQELLKIKADLQQAEDEKKFLVMDQKTKVRATAATTDALRQQATTPTPTKKRRVETPKKREFATVNPNRITPDEPGLFADSLLRHELPGAELATVDILDRVRLQHVGGFRTKTLEIPKGQPIGKCIVQFLLEHKRTVKLDKLIDAMLENLAVLIKEISFSGEECRLAIPFLVALMHQTISFRPSAVRTAALKDLFLFTSDLARAHQRVLKRPIHESPLELHVKPEIFQYELLDTLVVLYSFDVLETSLKVLQGHPPAAQAEFFDEGMLAALEEISKLALTISYRQILNVVYSAVEILNGAANLALENPLVRAKAEPRWWANTAARVYHVLGKSVTNRNGVAHDPQYLQLPPEANVYGLIRNIGDNHNGQFISQLIHRDRLQSIPRVVPKNFSPNLQGDGINRLSVGVEWWGLRLKCCALKLFEKLVLMYPQDRRVITSELLVNLTKLVAHEQECLLTVVVGQEAPNVGTRTELLELAVKLIYHIWQGCDPDMRHVKEIHSELTVCLWRIVFGGASNQAPDELESETELREHRLLLDGFTELALEDSIDYYEDAFDGDMPLFLSRELQNDANRHCRSILSVGADRSVREMAKTVLEGITSIEEADSLYLAAVPSAHE